MGRRNQSSSYRADWMRFPSYYRFSSSPVATRSYRQREEHKSARRRSSEGTSSLSRLVYDTHNLPITFFSLVYEYYYCSKNARKEKKRKKEMKRNVIVAKKESETRRRPRAPIRCGCNPSVSPAWSCTRELSPSTPSPSCRVARFQPRGKKQARVHFVVSSSIHRSISFGPMVHSPFTPQSREPPIHPVCFVSSLSPPNV